MDYSKQLFASAIALVFTACSGSVADPPATDTFAAATPDVAGLTLELEGGEDEGAPSPGPAPESTGAVGPLSITPPNDLLLSQAALRGLNGVVGFLVGKIAETVEAGGPPAMGDRKQYGPADRCVVGTDPTTCDAATFLLTVVHERDEVYSWRLEAWAVPGDPASAQGVAAGWMARGELAHRGVGRLALDLDHLSTIVPAYAGRGVLLAGFASGPLGKAVTYRLRGFTPDAEAHPPAFLTIGGFRNLVTGTNRIRVGTVAEIVPPPEGGSDLGPELVRSDFAWNPPLGGRSFGVVTNWFNPFLETLLLPAGPFGDVPFVTRFDEHYLHVRACYAPFTAALVFKQLFLCNGPGSDTPESPPACVARVGSTNGAVLFPATPTAAETWEARCAIDEGLHPGLVPPAGEPTTNPDDGRGPAEGLEGLPPPPAPPADPGDLAPPPAD
jgi:hypothetical protein